MATDNAEYIQHLEAENKQLRACHEAELGVCQQHCDIALALEAENKRLRTAAQYALSCGMMTESVCKKLKQALVKGERRIVMATDNEILNAAARNAEYILKLEAENKKLKYEVDTTRGLWCIDLDPQEVSIEWIRENALQLKALEGE